MMIRTYNKFDDLIYLKAKAAGVDPAVVKGIIHQESGFNAAAHRTEHGFYRRYIKGRKRWAMHKYYDQPEIIAAGIGLMQVQYTTALWMGYPPSLPWFHLYDPSVNIDHGIRWLRNRSAKYHSIAETIAAYNAGTARYADGDPSRFVNQHYVDKVYRFADEARKNWRDTGRFD